VVEVGASSLSDDLERKQLLKRLGVQEYWVVDVAAGQVTAFGISRREQPNSSIPSITRFGSLLIEEALKRSQKMMSC